MKPCNKNRKRVAWLALGVLGPQEDEQVRAHLQSCSGCRDYFQELSVVSEHLRKVRVDTAVESTDRFHRRVLGELKASSSEPSGRRPVRQDFWRRLRWRIAWPALGAAGALLVLLTFMPPGAIPPARDAHRPVASRGGARVDLEPTIQNYQLAASRSMDKLDELLNLQAGRNLPSTPVYRASALSVPGSSD